MTKAGTHIALVTGANRGIGLAIAAGLAKHSDLKVLLGSRNLHDGGGRWGYYLRFWACGPALSTKGNDTGESSGGCPKESVNKSTVSGCVSKGVMKV